MPREILLERPGVLVIDKPEGPTSAHVLETLKRKLKPRRIGHAGTLDPMATGILVCLLNNATRLASYAEHGAKIYSGMIRLGTVTSTDDIKGEVLTSSEEIPDFEVISSAASKLTGKLTQVPPQISAVRIDGERAYHRARRGEQVNIPAREVEVLSFDLLPLVDRIFLPFRVHCSRGTYIRSLARDLGEALGCGGCLETLRREGSAPFAITDAIELAQAEAEKALDWGILFPSAGRLVLTELLSQKLLNGKVEAVNEAISYGILNAQISGAEQIIVYSDVVSGRSLGLLKNDQGNWVIAANIG